MDPCWQLTGWWIRTVYLALHCSENNITRGIVSERPWLFEYAIECHLHLAASKLGKSWEHYALQQCKQMCALINECLLLTYVRALSQMNTWTLKRAAIPELCSSHPPPSLPPSSLPPSFFLHSFLLSSFTLSSSLPPSSLLLSSLPSLLLTHLQTWLHPHLFPGDTFLHPFETGYCHWQTRECSHSAYRTVSHSQVITTMRVHSPPVTALQEHTHLTALMCSQLATPVFTPFCSLVRPCTVRSYVGKNWCTQLPLFSSFHHHSYLPDILPPLASWHSALFFPHLQTLWSYKLLALIAHDEGGWLRKANKYTHWNITFFLHQAVFFIVSLPPPYLFSIFLLPSPGLPISLRRSHLSCKNAP